jgi:hypothetical protein
MTDSREVVKMSDQFVIFQGAKTGVHEFVDFWAATYFDPRESLYTDNIGKPLTPGSVLALFEWKNGGKLSADKEKSVKRHYVTRINDPRPSNVDQFLRSFGTSKGGSIWPIFWLHCCDQEFPIYDQHVHRAMTFIQGGDSEELDSLSDAIKVNFYLQRYLPFRKCLGGDGRKTDRALWMFGKFLKSWPSLVAIPN